jgi:hypothetical protein
VRNIKNVAPHKQKQERNTQIAIALLNYLKRIALQQINAKNASFHKKIIKRKKRN